MSPSFIGASPAQHSPTSAPPAHPALALSGFAVTRHSYFTAAPSSPSSSALSSLSMSPPLPPPAVPSFEGGLPYATSTPERPSASCGASLLCSNDPLSLLLSPLNDDVETSPLSEQRRSGAEGGDGSLVGATVTSGPPSADDAVTSTAVPGTVGHSSSRPPLPPRRALRKPKPLAALVEPSPLIGRQAGSALNQCAGSSGSGSASVLAGTALYQHMPFRPSPLVAASVLIPIEEAGGTGGRRRGSTNADDGDTASSCAASSGGGASLIATAGKVAHVQLQALLSGPDGGGEPRDPFTQPGEAAAPPCTPVSSRGERSIAVCVASNLFLIATSQRTLSQ